MESYDNNVDLVETNNQVEGGIKITDSDEYLDMYSYDQCFNDSPEDIKNNRGVVIEKSSGQVIVSSFGYTDIYTPKEFEEIQKILVDLSEWEFSYSIEATLLRIFNHNDKWYLSTHKKLDANKSRWSCKKTFGELFKIALSKKFDKNYHDVMDWFYSLLDPNKVYFFLLKSNYENRIVCQYNYKQESIIYLGFFDKGVFIKLNKEILIDEFNSFERPKEVQINSIIDLINKIETLNHFDYQGIIAINKNNPKQIKILNSEYNKYFQIRGNNPNLRFRYLELRNDDEKLKLLYYLYPKSADIFDQYEDILLKISRMIYHFYVSRYIKNQFITLPREEFLLMKKCHEWYLSDRKNNRIFSKKVLELMAEEPPINLYKMIRRYTLNNNYNENYFQKIKNE